MSIDAMQKALIALEFAYGGEPAATLEKEAIAALRQAIEQAEKDEADFQDFVAKVQELEKEACEIINREWVGLTDEEIVACGWCDLRFARAIEAKLKEKNYG